jgi:ubiquinone/menaquinone biosynthesis C-methylase UbiE
VPTSPHSPSVRDDTVAASRRGPRRGFFDAWARIYDVPLVQWATYRPVHNAVLGALRTHAPASVLDLGCGTGQLLQRLAEELPLRHLVGCDFSAGMLAHARARLAGVRRGPTLVRGDALRLPFRDGAFDAIVSTEAFHWFPDQDAAIAEIRRVLVRDGVLLLAFVNPPLGVVSEAIHVASRLLGTPLHWPTTTALRRKLDRGGFEVVAQRRIFRIPGFLIPPVLTEAVNR